METRICPACLAPSVAGSERCAVCSAPLERAPAAALARASSEAPPIVAKAPEGHGVVILQTTLVEEHPAPWWVIPVRITVLAGSVVMLPVDGVVLGALLLTIWVVSGLVVRYPVVLPPGRALFKGGLSNTATPGRHWLRRRRSETAHSIAIAPLYLDWRPAPTFLEQDGRTAWLELAAELWIEPCADDLGQFRALLTLHLWQEHPRVATKKLREEVLDALVEHVRATGLLERTDGRSVPVAGDDAVLAIALGLREAGFELRALGPWRAALVPHTEDLETSDRLWIDRRPPPKA